MSRRLAVLRSITIVSVSSYIEYALGLVMSVWIARALGPADFGRYAFTVWLCSWLITCSNHALTTSSTKFIAEAEGAGSMSVASHLAGNLNRVQHVSSMIVMAGFLGVIAILQPVEWRSNLFPVIVLVVIATVAKANFAMTVAIEKGQERFEPEAISTVLTGFIGIALVTVATVFHAGLLAFVAIFAISQLLLNLINRMAFRHFCTPFVAGPVPGEMHTRLTRHLKLTAVLVILAACKAGTVEVFLLNTFATSVAVGFFSIAITLTRGAVQLFSVGLTTTLLPYMAKTFGEKGQEHAARFLSEATRFYWAVGLMIAGLGLITTRQIVTLMYGTKYIDAIPAIETFLVLAGLLLLLNGISAFQTVVDRQDDRVRIGVVAMAVNIVLGLILVPMFGLKGAVFTYAGTRLTELLMSTYYLRRLARGAVPWTAMARLAVVAVLSTALGVAVVEVVPGHFGFVVGALVFVAVFLPCSILVRYWNEDDLRLIGGIAGRLGAPGRMLMRGLSSLQRHSVGSVP